MKARIVIALLAVSLAGIGGTALLSQAAEETTTKEEACCPAGDMTLPAELIKKFPPGELHSPYPDYAKLAKEEELVKQFRLPGCNECHGGGGGGGFCPALSSRRLVLGQHRRRAVQAHRAGFRGTRKARFRTLPVWHRSGANAADGCLHQEFRPALEDHRLHPVDQSAWNQSAREGDPGKDGFPHGKEIRRQLCRCCGPARRNACSAIATSRVQNWVG